ncbi:hypothetical protein DFJ73DRAFT_771951 [Zopfochytrium polystomum]|nr:hypothetical protein DFJ73DRAFT_771951 [Zopfochytrium polystomum]
MVAVVAHPLLDGLDWDVATSNALTDDHGADGVGDGNNGSRKIDDGAANADPFYIDATVIPAGSRPEQRSLLISKDSRWATCAVWALPTTSIAATVNTDTPTAGAGSPELLVDLIDGLFTPPNHFATLSIQSFVELPSSVDQRDNTTRQQSRFALSAGGDALRVVSLDDGAAVDSVSKDDCPDHKYAIAIAETGFEETVVARDEDKGDGDEVFPTAVFTVVAPKVEEGDTESDSETEHTCFTLKGSLFLKFDVDVVYTDPTGPFVFCIESCSSSTPQTTLHAYKPDSATTPTPPSHPIHSTTGDAVLVFAVDQWDYSLRRYPVAIHAVRISHASGALTRLWSTPVAFDGALVDRIAADRAGRRILALSRSRSLLAAFDMDTGAALLGGGGGAVSFAPPPGHGCEVTDAALDPSGRLVVVATCIPSSVDFIPRPVAHRTVSVFTVDSVLARQSFVFGGDDDADVRTLEVPDEVGGGDRVLVFAHADVVVATAVGSHKFAVFTLWRKWASLKAG